MDETRRCPGCENGVGTHKVEGDFLCDEHYSQYLFLTSIKEDDDSWQLTEGDY
jgi:hypothetical protein